MIVVFRYANATPPCSTKESDCLTNLFFAGDIPTPRSGHAVAHYGKYMFLYGGINFAEEVAYNDLYILDTGRFKTNTTMQQIYSAYSDT